MTARKFLKRLVRARMRKTGESYSSARRYFHTEDYEILGMNAEVTFGANRHEASMARGERARAARRSDNPVAECPLESVLCAI